MGKKLKIGLAVVLGIGGLFWGYRKYKAGGTKTPTYQTAKAEKGTLIVSLSASGLVATSNSRTVTTTASGVVEKIFVSEGQKVQTGQPILEIDLDLNGRQKLQAAYSSYQSAQNTLKTTQDKIFSLQSDLVGAKNVFDNQWASQSPDDPTYKQKYYAVQTAQVALDNLENSLKQARAALESTRLSYQLAGAVVRAPISGTVTAISLTPGMILNPTSEAANSSNLENKIAIVKTGATPSITVSLTEIDVPKVKVGNKVTITLDAFPDKTYTGKIMAIDTTGTVSSGVVSYPTTIQLDSGATEIMANMSATANIITGIKDGVVMVPVGAVQTQNEQTTIRVMINGKVESRPVEVGMQSNTQAEIVTGINEGDEVVTAVITAGNGQSGTTRSTSPFGSFGGGGVRMMR